MSNKTLLLNEGQISEMLEKMADEIINKCPDKNNIALIGIRTRGTVMSQRLKEILSNKLNIDVPLGVLDITLYRDDLSTLASQPIVGITDILFDINGKIIVLVDDVLYTGRTIRAALDAIVDFGRPKSILLTVLIDRGLREYPIQADIIGLKVETDVNQSVQVRLNEVDGDNNVFLISLDK